MVTDRGGAGGNGNLDGSVDMTFDPGINGPNGTINAIATGGDGSVFIGGDFNNGPILRSAMFGSLFLPVVGRSWACWVGLRLLGLRSLGRT